MTTPNGDRTGPARPAHSASVLSVSRDGGAAPLKSDNLRLPDPDAGRLPASARNVLSKDEIEALLNPDLSDLPVPSRTAEPAQLDEASPFNADKASRTQALTAACDVLVARLSYLFQDDGEIGASLRLAAAETRPFRATMESFSGRGAQVCLADEEGRVGAVILLPAEAASAMIERAGGASDTLALSAMSRPLTAIDKALLTEAISPFLGIIPSLNRVQVLGDRMKAAAAAPAGDAIRLSLTLQLGSRGWPVTVLIDGGLLSPEGGWNDSPPAEAERQDRHAELAPPVPGAGSLTALLTARIASLSVPLSHLGGLKPGATLKLGLPADSPVTLLSGDASGPVVAEGALGRDGDAIAVRLTRKRRAFS